MVAKAMLKIAAAGRHVDGKSAFFPAVKQVRFVSIAIIIVLRLSVRLTF
jgi:hypothetical protein